MVVSMSRRLVFASQARSQELANALAQELGKPVGILDKDTGPLALRKVIVGMGVDEFAAVVATQRWALGWRAPLGWTVEFDESFTDDPGYRAQAEMRVPTRATLGSGEGE
jgi:hypothetical protein